MSRVIGTSEMAIRTRDISAINYVRKDNTYTNPTTKVRSIKYILYIYTVGGDVFSYDYYFDYDSKDKQGSYDRARISMHQIFDKLIHFWHTETETGTKLDLSEYNNPKKTIV